MTTMKYTPSPWVIENPRGPLQGESYVIAHPGQRDEQGALIARVYLNEGGTNGAFANAKLIAAAPDLLAACERLMNPAMDAMGKPLAWSRADDIAFARAAIAKADGR